ncbi:MAG: TolC family protein [Polyangiaceae bacterium]|nr:TolC family protein [Polyangiaceae bacterium]
MNRTPRSLPTLIGFFVLGLPLVARAQDASAVAPSTVGTASATRTRSLSETEAVALALAQNPSFKSSKLQYDRAVARVRVEEGAFPWELQADGGLTHNESPTVNADRDVSTSRTDTMEAGLQLDKSFATGTALSLRVQGDRYQSHRPMSTIGGGEAGYADSSGYDMAARASVMQPLLRGRGREVGLASLRNARIQRTQAAKARDAAASSLVQNVLTAYWEAWYAKRSLELEREALDLAETQRRAAEARRDAGALAPVDVLSFETREAELLESVVAAEATLRQRYLSLWQLVGGATAPTTLTGDPPEHVAVASQDTIVAALETSSPELVELAERVRLAEAQAAIAGEQYRAQLNVESYAEARGVSEDSLPPAIGQVARMAALSAHLGLVYRTPLSGRRKANAQAEADLGVSIARSDLEAARQRLLTSTLTVVSNTRAAEARYEAAKKTAGVSRRLFDAEQQRFAAGTSTPLQVQEAEDSLRQAQQRVVRAQVDLAVAGIELQHATGELLERYVTANDHG